MMGGVNIHTYTRNDIFVQPARWCCVFWARGTKRSVMEKKNETKSDINLVACFLFFIFVGNVIWLRLKGVSFPGQV